MPDTPGGSNTGGLLIALSEAPEGREEDFTRWYDEEHSPARLKVPGITSAQRYVAVDGEPAYFAYYDLDSADVLTTAAYTTLRSNRSAREAEIIQALPVLERRIYRALGDERVSTAYSPDAARHLLAVWMTMEAGHEDDLHDWYREEHAPMLIAVEGWLRIRRFELLEGPGPRHLALHDLADLDVFDRPEYKAALDTPWRRRVADRRVGYQRVLYNLHKRF